MTEHHFSSHISQYALITDHGRILLLERARSKTWCLPGGRLNDNEEPYSALLREIKEELNLECNNPIPVAVNVLRDEYQTKYCVYFQINCLDTTIVMISNEHSNYGWFSIDEVDNLNIEDDKIKQVIQSYLE